MARPRKCRRICRYPETLAFHPESGAREEILLAVEEFEALRLMDREGLSQEETARRMNVARTTVQQIYASARKKLADALVEGRSIRIGGGDFALCQERFCETCFKDHFSMPKGDNIMRIAVTYENGMIFQHFGHTQQFKIYDIVDGKVAASQVVDTMGSGHGALAGVLNALNADVLICGGIGGGAQMALAQAGIRLYGGVSGSADAAVAALLSGELLYNPDVRCDHHDHHGEGHACGDHGCGSHSCH